MQIPLKITNSPKARLMQNNSVHINQERYSRQVILPEIGEAGQRKLANSSVLIIGCGGLGVPVALYLASAGVGTLGLMDADTISPSNLHRQVIYTESDLGQRKASVLEAFIKRQNPNVHTKTYFEFARNRSVLDRILEYDLVVDCTDNFASRYLINDACVLAEKPMVYGAVNGFEGQASIFNVKTGEEFSGMYRDLFPKEPEPGVVQNCEEAGVMGHLPGIVGTVMAGEALKFLSGMDDLLVNKLWLFDGKSMQSNVLKFKPKPRKPMELVGRFQSSCKVFEVPTVTWKQLQDWDSSSQEYELVDVREINEHQIANAGGRNIPLSTINLHLPEFQAMKKPLVFYCQSGQRSSRAVHDVQEDIEDVQAYSVVGGMKSR